MSTLPRFTGKGLVRVLERAGFVRHADGRATVVPHRTRTLGLGLLRKILSDCCIKPEQLEELL